jgi:hypothetical protein
LPCRESTLILRRKRELKSAALLFQTKLVPLLIGTQMLLDLGVALEFRFASR